MCFDFKWLLVMLLVASCTQYRILQKINSGEVVPAIAVQDDPEPQSQDEISMTDSLEVNDGPVIMNAIRDSETGEMVATDVINASRVTARFRNVAERSGYVTIGFEVTVPSDLTQSAWKLEMCPEMVLQEDTLELEPLYIAGQAYRDAQLRGYERYNRFLESIIEDPDHFVMKRQLEIFLERYFPEIYAMRTDSSYVAEPVAENLFGVSRREAVLHYRKKLSERANDRRRDRKDRMYARYVKDPIIKEGVRLDTVVRTGDGFVYRYSHVFRSRPGLKKAVVYLTGHLYERGEKIADIPESEDMTYYISSLSTMADMSPRYRMIILERMVYDNTKALVDFAHGSAVIDTMLSDNASELRRIGRCIDDVASRDDLVLDSLVISASCSPEGEYEYNSVLAEARASAVAGYVSRYVPESWDGRLKLRSIPENWEQFRLVVGNDSLIGPKVVRKIMEITSDLTLPDKTEGMLASMSCYRYLREKIYPMLRSVQFDFYLHRSGMQKDTVHTTEPDLEYMAGLEALKELDYKRAVSILRPYKDYNSALAFMAAEYNHSALDVLKTLDEADPKVCYLMAVIYSRLGQDEMAERYFRQSLSYDPYLKFRANLDPEMARFAAALENEY